MEIGQKGAKVLACGLVGARESGTGRPIFVSELDLEQILKAKAAVYAGVKTLLTSKGRSVAELDRLILAGGFAKYIDIENAIAIGMLPEMPRERIQVIGNGSLAGAYLALVDTSVTGIYEGTIKAPKKRCRSIFSLTSRGISWTPSCCRTSTRRNFRRSLGIESSLNDVAKLRDEVFSGVSSSTRVWSFFRGLGPPLRILHPIRRRAPRRRPNSSP
jgi:hypothetical protein